VTKGDGSAELPADVYRRIERYLGTGKADDVVEQVRSGFTTIADADAWSRAVEQQWERSRNRPDIEPEDWQAFEEGWRPEGW
jgi:hypothetical protein